MTTNILITGANGQIGQILNLELAKNNRVYATDINTSQGCLFLDILDQDKLIQFIQHNNIKQIYHLAAILSAKGEQNPLQTWQINMSGLLNILEAGRICKLDKIFFPSTIAVFGFGANQDLTSNFEALHPSTVYGISKASAENWCQYYYNKYNLDVRSIRYPGIIGWQTLPGGGTTDYAIDIFHQLIKTQAYTCFLDKDVNLPMMYMDDAIAATIQIMQSPFQNIKVRTSYNVAGCSFTPQQLFNCIKQQMPNVNLNIKYEPDFRNAIAKTWPFVIDDKIAEQDWGWKAKFNTTESIVKDMLSNLSLPFNIKT